MPCSLSRSAIACPTAAAPLRLPPRAPSASLALTAGSTLEAAATVQGWFGVFGQIEWAPRSGKFTIFGGPKVSGKIPGTEIGGSFKDGLYVQIGKDGYLADFGFRTSVSGNAGFGPFAIKGSESMDFSFAPVFGIAR